jgi:2-polyprenyl-3-methyl-5-hydroxy-6-metoxy-1,4-benzoquinol methylase
MENARVPVESHYARGEILNSILRALGQMGKEVSQLVPSDLAPVDEFHIRGREATVELAERASLKPGLRVLDVGSGLGGSVRYLTSEHQCRVTGIDLAREYVAVADALAELREASCPTANLEITRTASPKQGGAPTGQAADRAR